MERGFIEAAQDAEVAFYLDLRSKLVMTSIRKHPLLSISRVPNVANSAVQALLQESVTAINTLGDAITRDSEGRR